MSNLSLLNEGQPVPAFTYREADGNTRNTKDLIGSSYVVYFYPKDDTPGCTKEACGFRDQYQEFIDKNLTVIGVSPDSDDSHEKFRRKFNLPFPLASDPDHRIAKAFGAWGPKTFMGRDYEGVHRVTFLIDAGGHVSRVYPKVMPDQHAQQILQDASTKP